jgi:hypothetical protein
VALARPAKGGTPWEFYYPPVSISVNIKHKSSVFVSLTKTSHDFQKFNLCVEYHVITRGAKYFECLFDVNIEFHLKDETITPLPMRPFHLLNVASGRVSLVFTMKDQMLLLNHSSQWHQLDSSKPRGNIQPSA